MECDVWFRGGLVVQLRAGIEDLDVFDFRYERSEAVRYGFIIDSEFSGPDSDSISHSDIQAPRLQMY